MGIDVAWVNERHESKQDVFDSRQCLARLASSEWPRSNTVCLRFIDVCGDAVFNQAQIPVLLAELRSTLTAQRDEQTKDHLVKVIRLVECAVDRTHTYIKFIGD